MKKCIYTLNDGTNATFNSKEHILPRSIGGIGTLNNHWVCDDFNNYISKAEREFARKYPLITLPRMMNVSTGRKEHVGKLGVGFILIPEVEESLQLGYIAEGKPRIMNQIVVSIPKLNQGCLDSLFCIVEKAGEEFDFISDLLKYKKKKIVVKTDDELFRDFLAIGYVNKQAYIGIYAGHEDNIVEKYTEQLLKLVSDKKLEFGDYGRTEGVYKVSYQGKSSFCLEDIKRVYAKIAFNVLAHIKGQEFVLREGFDPIRQAIRTGESIKELVSNPCADVSKKIADVLKLHNNEHLVLLFKEQETLCGAINLFGDASGSIMVKLSTNWEDFFDTTGYVCDWKNKKEYTLEKYLMEVYLGGKDVVCKDLWCGTPWGCQTDYLG